LLFSGIASFADGKRPLEIILIPLRRLKADRADRTTQLIGEQLNFNVKSVRQKLTWGQGHP
jgi:hypothetical protein